MIDQNVQTETHGSVQQEHCGRMDGEDIWKISVSDNIIDVVITNVGCSVMKILVKDKYGKKVNVVAGFDSPNDYLDNKYYVGCIVGRYANRIKKGKFFIDGREYQLTKNDGDHHLHGGDHGLHTHIWKLDESGSNNSSAFVKLSYVSIDGEEGYPGTLKVVAEYIVNDGALHITYRAVTDKATVVNLANHSFFNLSGFEDPTIYMHSLQVNAKQYTVTDRELIPTGELHPVANTPYDFTELKEIGAQIRYFTDNRGYDINFCIARENKQSLSKCAVLWHPVSDRKMEVFSNQYGLQIYTANNWNNPEMIEKGFCKNAAIALETQAFPDSPNHPTFPFQILKPGEIYEAKTMLKFDC